MAGLFEAVQLLKPTETTELDDDLPEIDSNWEDASAEVPQPLAASESSPKIPTKAVLPKPQGGKSPMADKGPTMRPVSWGSGVWIC